MFYRVVAILHFTEEDEAKDFYHDCEVALPKAETINPGQVNQEIGTILLSKCHHDEQPVLSCEQIETASTS